MYVRQSSSVFAMLPLSAYDDDDGYAGAGNASQRMVRVRDYSAEQEQEQEQEQEEELQMEAVQQEEEEIEEDDEADEKQYVRDATEQTLRRRELSDHRTSRPFYPLSDFRVFSNITSSGLEFRGTYSCRPTTTTLHGGVSRDG